MADIDDADDLPDLPDLGEDDDDEPAGDDELGLERAFQGEDEHVGLDDSAGFDDDSSLFALELPPEDSVTDEEGVDAIPVEGLDGDDEYGWTDTGATTEDEPWDAAELDLPGLSPIAGEDGGEEGVEDVLELSGGDEVLGLPPLRERNDDDEGDDDLALGEDALIEAAVLSYDEERRQMGATLPPRLEAPACIVTHLGPESAVYCVTAGPPPLAGGAAGLIEIGEHARVREAVGLEHIEVVSIAADPTDARRMVVGTRLAGALRSIDAGASFEPANGWARDDREVAQAFFVSRESASRPRVWGRTAGGALFRSDDFGASWTGPLLLKPVVALATPDEGGLVSLCAGRDSPAQIARSDDGGQRWAAVGGPPLAAGSGEHYLAALREWVAVSLDDDAEGPYLSGDRGKSWTRVPGLPPTGPMALVWEPGGLTLYAAHFFDAGDRGVVVRHRPGGGEGAVVLDVAREVEARGIVAAGDPEGDHRVHEIHAQHAERLTVLHVATGTGLFRVLVDPDRAP